MLNTKVTLIPKVLSTFNNWFTYCRD